jgi:RNA polymerase sigma-70 factor (ECF subfamily)
MDAMDAVLTQDAAIPGVAAGAMDEESFRAFYDRTARPLWAYLSRITGNPAAVDDLLQEAYYRFVRAGAAHESEAHRRNSLYRIATNLARDRARRGAGAVLVPIEEERPSSERLADRVEHRADLARAMARLEPKERQMLWLAYAEGSSHEEIAGIVGVKAVNVRTLLFRARRRLAGILGEGNGRG